MTITEMHIGVGVQLQQVASYSYDDFQPEEIDYYLNLAIKKWIRQKQQMIILTEGNVPESISEDLYTVTKSVFFALNNPGPTEGKLVNSVTYDNGVRADLSTIPSDDFYLYLFSKSRVGTEWKNNKLVLPSRFLMYSETRYNKPYFRTLPSILQEGSLITLRSVEDDILDKLLLTYVRQPATVVLNTVTPADSVDCDLPEHTHDEVVDLAVQLMRGDLAVGLPNDQ